MPQKEFEGAARMGRLQHVPAKYSLQCRLSNFSEERMTPIRIVMAARRPALNCR